MCCICGRTVHNFLLESHISLDTSVVRSHRVPPLIMIPEVEVGFSNGFGNASMGRGLHSSRRCPTPTSGTRPTFQPYIAAVADEVLTTARLAVARISGEVKVGDGIFRRVTSRRNRRFFYLFTSRFQKFLDLGMPTKKGSSLKLQSNLMDQFISLVPVSLRAGGDNRHTAHECELASHSGCNVDVCVTLLNRGHHVPSAMSV